MQANWSLILNILLLVTVIFAIGRMIKERRNSHANNRQAASRQSPPSVGMTVGTANYDDIIAVRKINPETHDEQPAIQSIKQPDLYISEERVAAPAAVPSLETAGPQLKKDSSFPVMIFLMAKENRQLAGYELLQTLLAEGLRFGEGQLFHRHQNSNGQGPVLCSLAAATASGVFDLQNIGAFSARGLCLFMQASGHPAIDAERFAVMLDTAKQLSEGLDTYLLDDQQKPFSDASLKRYYEVLNISDICEQTEVFSC
jgi:cell division protein ZipA